jgi:hypothetical protein
MNWYYTIAGGHTHVRVFMNGAKCVDLCFRNEEFEQIKRQTEGPPGYGQFTINFINETPEPKGD